jgi:hypothetical protein
MGAWVASSAGATPPPEQNELEGVRSACGQLKNQA